MPKSKETHKKAQKPQIGEDFRDEGSYTTSQVRNLRASVDGAMEQFRRDEFWIGYYQVEWSLYNDIEPLHDEHQTKDKEYRQTNDRSQWKWEVDNKFFLQFIKDIEVSSTPRVERANSINLCTVCRDIALFDRTICPSELRNSRHDCWICELLRTQLVKTGINSREYVHVQRLGSYICIPSLETRICHLLMDSSSQDDDDCGLQLGIPDIQTMSGNKCTYLKLLRQWLGDCDNNHDCRPKYRTLKDCPTRLIFVGTAEDEEPRLFIPEKTVDYLALSHRWGKVTNDNKDVVQTTRDNYQDRLQGFSLNDLPKTFQDAVHVTSGLGLKHLWIDSLCIIQGEGGDWETEAQRMHGVFSNAYCTIAAVAADNWDEGFIRQNPPTTYKPIQDIGGRRVYISDLVDDFQHEVEEAPLNKRGWVLQERVLSRRIIYFASNYTYWECGATVRCDNFSTMTCLPGRHSFLQDPHFPDRLEAAGYHQIIDVLQYLFKKYASSTLTYESDREMAIKSLMLRMKRVFDTEESYGTFQEFLHRLLLWRRVDVGDDNLPRYRSDTNQSTHIPTWSWMKCSAIDFLGHDIGSYLRVAPIQYDLRQNDALSVKVNKFENCKIDSHHMGEYDIMSIRTPMTNVGSVWFDDAPDLLATLCVVVGIEKDYKVANKDNASCYILIVQRLPAIQYKRIGLGKVEAQYIDGEGCPGLLI